MGKLENSEEIIRSINVDCKKNNVKKTFYEFLSFYKNNLYKNKGTTPNFVRSSFNNSVLS